MTDYEALEAIGENPIDKIMDFENPIDKEQLKQNKNQRLKNLAQQWVNIKDYKQQKQRDIESMILDEASMGNAKILAKFRDEYKTLM